MNSATVLVVVMGLSMAAIGVVVARLSKHHRGAGIVIAVLGLMFVTGYFFADDTAPLPGSGTATPELPFSFPGRSNP